MDLPTPNLSQCWPHMDNVWISLHSQGCVASLPSGHRRNASRLEHWHPCPWDIGEFTRSWHVPHMATPVPWVPSIERFVLDHLCGLTNGIRFSELLGHIGPRPPRRCTGWDTVNGFLHTPSEHLAMPNPGPNANCPKRSENARHAGSGTLERAAVPQHRCNIAGNAWRNPQCLRGSCYPTYGNGDQWAHDSGVFQRHGSGSGGDW